MTPFQLMQQQINTMDRQLTRTRQIASGLQAESILRDHGRAAAILPLEFVAQFGEDIIAWEILSHQMTGFFIEAGAFDGYRYSVTYALEAMGWRGLLVEGIPERAAQCAGRRPNSRVVNAVLSPDGVGDDSPFYVMQDQYGGMLSYSRMTPQRLADLGDAPRTAVAVPRASLNALLADHHGPVDLVVLDIEGDEFDALQGFNLARFRPRVLIIEDNSGGQDQAVKTFMQQHDYHAAGRLAVNEIYVRKDEAEILEQLKWLAMP